MTSRMTRDRPHGRPAGESFGAFGEAGPQHSALGLWHAERAERRSTRAVVATL
ncbi:hypothetical protein K2X85_11735 [bacterium]|nr:hypothetical protein [bacterium]